MVLFSFLFFSFRSFFSLQNGLHIFLRIDRYPRKAELFNRQNAVH